MGMNDIKRGSTKRIQNLLNVLIENGFSDRSDEWFDDTMFPNIKNENLSIIERRALSFSTMLKAMVSSENNTKTHTFEIKSGELIVGVIPMGSVGLGKVFPQYFTEEEKRLLTVSNRDILSTFGHNVPNHKLVLDKGLKWICEYCETEVSKISIQEALTNRIDFKEKKKLYFYKAVKICCESVIEYAKAFSELALQYMKTEENEERRAELAEISRICTKVPENPAETFQEATQAIYFIHLALHSTLDYMSIGRMDQLLEPFLVTVSEKKALELIECFFIKCAERLNMNPQFFTKQDHSSFGGVFGDSPVFLDQIASANNFLQNIVIGGMTKDGNDASNKCTLLILNACGNLGLPTPSVNIRIHKNTSQQVLTEAVHALRRGRCGLPAIYNDDVIIQAFWEKGIQLEVCRDYVVDGCWEPILNANSDWIFGMLNFLTILECSLNSGCTFSTDKCLLLGNKLSYRTRPATEIRSFEELMENIKVHTQFFLDRIILMTYSFYSVEGAVNPTPFFSALLGGCLESGMDKTWGGSEYHLSGALACALPNCANALVNIKKYVFEEKKYELTQVVEALKENFKGYDEMKNLFWNDSQKFGNNVGAVDEIMKALLDCFYEASLKAKELGDKVFLLSPKQNEEKILSDRTICHYEGKSMQEKYGENFRMHYTIGCGTFGQYSLMGKSVGASADGRMSGEPIASNFSPVAGTMKNGLANILESLQSLGLERFAAGVVIDFCIDDAVEETDSDYFEALLKEFVAKKGSILTLTFISKEELINIFEKCEAVRCGKLSSDDLRPYCHISVRVGGYNAPFVTLPREQQLNYVKRII